MMNAEKEIEKVLDFFRRKEDGYREDSYCEFLDKEDREEYTFEEEMEKVFKKLGITQYNFCRVGGFESPGYDLNCVYIAYIDLDGKLKVISVNFEIR